MRTIYIVASAEIRALFRERTTYALTSIFLLMTAASSFIGWSTFTTADAVYRAAVVFQHARGISLVPDNPLHGIPALAGFDNLIVYISLIGALLAIIIGHRSIMRERRSGILQVLFTRPVLKRDYVFGKVIGVGAVLFGVILLTALVSIVSSAFLPFQHIGIIDVGHLLVFFFMSFLYMLFFALCGLYFSIIAKSESLALFIPIFVWVAITFVLPELATGLTPTALLNPISMLQIVPPEGFFSMMRLFLYPISLGWHYTVMSGELLGSAFNPRLPLVHIFSVHWTEILTLIGSLGVLGFFSVFALREFDAREDYVNE